MCLICKIGLNKDWVIEVTCSRAHIELFLNKMILITGNILIYGVRNINRIININYQSNTIKLYSFRD